MTPAKFLSATWADADHRAAFGVAEDGTRWLVQANDARLQGLAISDYVPPPVPPGTVQTWKSDVWRRMEPEEAEQFDTALQQAPVRQRRLWDDSTVLIHASPDFAMLRDLMVQAFGATRTDVLLAPSI